MSELLCSKLQNADTLLLDKIKCDTEHQHLQIQQDPVEKVTIFTGNVQFR